MKNTLLFLFAVSALVSCRKPENRICFKSNGPEKTIEVSVDAFNRLFLNPHVAYVLVQDSLNKLEITGGENLVNHIAYEVKDGLLEIKNKNKCAFLRKSKELVVTIHFTELINVHYEGSVYLKSVGTIKSDYFVLQVRDGAGPVTLDLKSIIIDADISHGWGDYTLTGETQVARISARSNGYCNTYGLNVSDSIYIASETPGNVKVRVDGIPLYGYIKGSGNIWYQGTPSFISVVQTGEGRVVDKN